MMLLRISAISFLLLAVTASSLDAQTYRQMGTRRGVVAGAVVGGLIGGNNDHTALGIVTGGIVGGLAGNAIGARKDANSYNQNYGYSGYGYQNYPTVPQSYSYPSQRHGVNYGYQQGYSQPVYQAPATNYQHQHNYQTQPVYDHTTQYQPQYQQQIQAPQPYQYQYQSQQYQPQPYHHGW